MVAGQGHCGVVSARYEHPPKQFLDAQLFPLSQSHRGLSNQVGPLNCDRVRETVLFQDEQSGHQFCQACRRHRQMFRLLHQYPTGFEIVYQDGHRADVGRRLLRLLDLTQLADCVSLARPHVPVDHSRRPESA